MVWWGKLIGGIAGYFILGPVGVVLGVVIGHQFDNGMSGMGRLGGLNNSGQGWISGNQERIQTTFFTALFSVIGHIAKADGHVSKEEIEMARNVMTQMSLNETQTRIAIELFNKGKQDDFNLDEILKQFRHECRRRRNLMQMFLEVLLSAAYADGVMHPKEKSQLQYIAEVLGFSADELEHLEVLIRNHHNIKGDTSSVSLDDAYAVLGVSETDSSAVIKKAYRRLMNQHHPDKLVSKGLPEEMIKLATVKTQEIKSAYEKIKNS